MEFALLGVCYDKTQTMRKGAAKAPDVIRNVLPKLETFVSGIDLSEYFIQDLGNIRADKFEELEKSINNIRFQKFPLIIGGEHSISLPLVKLLKPKKFVSFDAHPDLENKDGHSGVMRKIVEILGPKNVFIYGVRTMSKKENFFIKDNIININSLSFLKKIKEPTYLSIDFDILDPSVLSSVGNPEPEGFSFKELIDSVRVIARNLIAVDFVEFTPSNNETDNVIAGKIIYAVIAEIIRSKS